MRNAVRSLRALLLAVLLANAPDARAEVIVSNSDNEPSFALAVAAGAWLAAGFQNDGLPRTLTSVSLFADGLDQGMVAELRSDSIQGTLVDLVVPLAGGGLLPAEPFELQPGATYYVVLGYPLGSTDVAEWTPTLDTSWIGEGTMLGGAYSEDQGDHWATVGFTARRLIMHVEAEVVDGPEPSAAGLGAAAIGALHALAAPRRRARP